MVTASYRTFNRVGRNSIGIQILLALGLALFVARAGVAGNISQVEQIQHARLFSRPLTWVGSQPPTDAESIELLTDIGTFKTNGVAAGFEELEKFVKAHPDSAWTPSLEVNMAEYWRKHGRYSLALSLWEAAWNATKGNQDAGSQKLAVRAMAGWTRLLASIGEKQKL